MKRLVIISLACLLAGCVESSPHTGATPPPLAAAALNSRPAAALIFTPPVTLGTPALDLSRADREPEAFWGFSQGTTESYDVELDDRQYTDPWTGGYREAYSERSGIYSR